jgi:hypothetical protein
VIDTSPLQSLVPQEDMLCDILIVNCRFLHSRVLSKLGAFL